MKSKLKTLEEFKFCHLGFSINIVEYIDILLYLSKLPYDLLIKFISIYI